LVKSHAHPAGRGGNTLSSIAETAVCAGLVHDRRVLIQLARDSARRGQDALQPRVQPSTTNRQMFK